MTSTTGSTTPVGVACEPATEQTVGTGAPRRRSFLHVACSALTTLLVGALVVVAVAVTAVPALAGGRSLTVLTGSMVPAIPVGSVVVERPVAPRTLTVGDVVTYATAEPLTGAPLEITHRIVAVHRTPAGLTFTTKGDANDVADTLAVRPSQIRGKVWYHIPYVGWLRNLIVRPGVGLMALGAVALGVAAWASSARRRARRVTARLQGS